jgi:hypothetical protein
MDDDNPFLAPELRSRRLNGRVYGHPLIKDGANVSTSALQEFDLKNKVAKR